MTAAPLARRLGTLLGAGLLAVVPAAPALAHGGGHPTPWPTGAPPATPFPGGPAGPTGASAGATSTSRETWEGWWAFNQWRYLKLTDARTLTPRGSSTEAVRPEASEVDVLRLFFLDALAREKHHDPRSAAALALGKAEVVESAEALGKLLADKDAHRYERECAALGLGVMRSLPSAPALLRIVMDQSNERRLRVHAVVALGLLRDGAAVGPLEEVLAREDEAEIHAAAALVLGLVPDPRAGAALLRLARSPSAEEEVRAAAASALGRGGREKVEDVSVADLLRDLLLSEKSDLVRQSAALCLHRFGGSDPFRALLRASDLDKDKTTRGLALVSLALWVEARGETADRAAATEAARRTLLTGGQRVAGFGALALGILGAKDPGCAPPLRTVFLREGAASSSAANPVASACAIGLGLMRDAESRKKILECAKKHRDLVFRGYCIIALGLLGAADREGVADLRKILEEENDPGLKGAAAVALANIGDRGAIPSLVAALRERNKVVQSAALLALGYFRELGVTRHLLEFYWAEKDAQYRAIAIAALGNFAEKSRPPVLRALSVDFNYLLVQYKMPVLDVILRLF
ncbi:MAG: HEAT repeat domain-containing protein [Planctomycetales bacterium]|nr:HEAT repeat domain-containing protein [Planctomycetales bacterium]